MKFPQFEEYLLVDLTQRTTRNFPLPDDSEGVLPGLSLASWLLEKHQPPGADALSPDSAIVLAPGVLAGLPFPGGTRVAIATKSPVTGFWAGGTMGGDFAWALRRSRWAALVITGRSDTLSSLFLDEGRAFFPPARRLSGLSLPAVKQRLKDDWGGQTAVLGIGPAGETGLYIAHLLDGTAEPGLRGGLGAVFGSKNLKVIAIRPDRGIQPVQPRQLFNSVVPRIQSLKNASKSPALELASLTGLRRLSKAAALPADNFRTLSCDTAWLGQVEKLPLIKRACVGCPIECRQIYFPQNDSQNEHPSGIPVFPEHLWALGPLAGVNSAKASIRALQACWTQGVDPISVGGLAAWTRECRDRGIDLGIELPKDNAGGWAAWVGDLPRKLSTDDQLRVLFGAGLRRAAERIGGNALALAALGGSEELGWLDPRRAYWPFPVLGTVLGVPWGLESEAGWMDDENALKALVAWEDRRIRGETIGICHWATTVQPDQSTSLPETVKLAFGYDISVDDLDRWGRRCLERIKAYDWREGWKYRDSLPSERFFAEAVASDKKSYPACNREKWIRGAATYFSLRGWSETGKPRE